MVRPRGRGKAGGRGDSGRPPPRDRHNKVRTITERQLPYDEVTLLLWNGSPLDLDSNSGNGWLLFNPESYSYAFWLGRFIGAL